MSNAWMRVFFRRSVIAWVIGTAYKSARKNPMKMIYFVLFINRVQNWKYKNGLYVCVNIMQIARTRTAVHSAHLGAVSFSTQ